MGWPSLSFEDDMDIDAYKFVINKPVFGPVLQDIFFEPCEKVATAPTPKKPCPMGRKKKETKMRYDDEYNDEYVEALPSKSDESQKRDYLENRVRYTQRSLQYDARKTYGLVDDESPNTLNDLVKRIQDGKYVIPEEYAKEILYNPISYIKWRDPDLKEDKDGYSAFIDRLNKEVTKTMDVVKIADPADGLKAIQALEQFK